MDKTEKRTAFEIYDSILSESRNNGMGIIQVIEETSKMYTAQELDAYKTRLKEAISKHQLYGETTNLVKRYEILNLIDKL